MRENQEEVGNGKLFSLLCFYTFPFFIVVPRLSCYPSYSRVRVSRPDPQHEGRRVSEWAAEHNHLIRALCASSLPQYNHMTQNIDHKV